MSISRRSFIAAAAAAPLAGAVAADDDRSGRRLLVLGGTRFLGPAVVEAAQAAGWTVTLFNRGRTNPSLFPDLEKLRGDRDPDVGDGLRALEGRRWDAAIDTSGQQPRHAQASSALLRDAVRRYVFVSTISVYRDPDGAGTAEDAPRHRLADLDETSPLGLRYGANKAACEDAVLGLFGERGVAVRPGVIVGPRNDSHRFRHWPVRHAAGGEMLAPGDGRDPVQVIDARDLGAWLVALAGGTAHGAMNAIDAPMPFAELLETCRVVTGAATRLTWVSADFLAAEGVHPFTDLPIWLPRTEHPGFFTVGADRARAAGLACRPLVETMRDVLDEVRAEHDGDLARAGDTGGLSREREAALLRAWHARAAEADDDG